MLEKHGIASDMLHDGHGRLARPAGVRPGWGVNPIDSFLCRAYPAGTPLMKDHCFTCLFAIVLMLFCNGTAKGVDPNRTPEAALSRMTLPEGFRVKAFATEPKVVQPVAIEFDHRGRLWVVQYIQYPNPAGLKRVEIDRWSRTIYDRVPEPPPRGPKGADRITILEDTDGDGIADKAKDFVSGLNLASGIAFGHGGVFVLQVPYLLFYPDRDGDDVPDSDPEVLLTGFGMEDAHSVANSLTFGPDGWLYGCQGSTVTANIRGIEFQQGVWRYHPLTREFELFCEGGGNSWGLDFTDEGELIYTTNIGGYRMLHGVQGGYYWKSFGKHGPLHNPHAYGYFEHVPYSDFKGGHVAVGGTLYTGEMFPASFRGKFIAGDLLGHAVQWHYLKPYGSSFVSGYGGELLTAHDDWFASTDVTQGPDGAIYVADWYDERTAHPDPDAEWDRSNGRIYRIEYGEMKPKPVGDLDLATFPKLPTPRLISLLGHKNGWLARKARQILADRRDPEAILSLRTLVMESKNDQLALEAFWALYVSGGFNETFAEKTLLHRHPAIRRWTVRFLGDEKTQSAAIKRKLIELARTEPDVRVRSQLASTAKRLSPNAALELAVTLTQSDQDVNDPHMPLLIWWAFEKHCIDALQDTVTRFTAMSAWRGKLSPEILLPRLMRRYAAEGTEAALNACGELLWFAPSEKQKLQMLAALEQGLQDRPANTGRKYYGSLFENSADVAAKAEAKPQPATLPAELAKVLASTLWKDDTQDAPLIRLLARSGDARAMERAKQLALANDTKLDLRIEILRFLGETGRAEFAPKLAGLLEARQPEPIQLAALEALQGFDGDVPLQTILRVYPALNDRLRGKAREVAFSRKPWALGLLREIAAARIKAPDVPTLQVRPLALHEDESINALVVKLWGSVKAGTAEEKLAQMRKLNNDLRARYAPGNPDTGRALYQQLCAACHRLWDDGATIGPDLTHANRGDREFLLASIVDPSAMIRKEYLTFNLETTDDRLVTGLLVEQTPTSVTLLTGLNERVTVRRENVRELRESPVSLMPEGLLDGLDGQSLRDLFSYLQATEKPVTARAQAP